MWGNNQLAKSTWLSKYSKVIKDGQQLEFLDPNTRLLDIAQEIYRIEQKYINPINVETIYELLKDFKYLVLAGSNIVGIANEVLTSLANCFVIGNEVDSYGGICESDQQQIQLMKRRGGVGHDLSHIRPKGSPVNNAAQTSTGIVPFAQRYSNSCREVAQDGRRGALMLTLDIEHDDAIDFIKAKTEFGTINGANISVTIGNNFFENIGSSSNQEKWKILCESIWKCAEPGVLFWDKIMNESTGRGYGKEWKIKSTNPCAEQALPVNDSCRLVAINLYNYVKNKWCKDSDIDYEKLAKDIVNIVRITDDIVDLEMEKISKIIRKVEIEQMESQNPSVYNCELQLWKDIFKMCESGRRIGIGTMGEADLLAAIGLRYSSKEANETLEQLHKFIAIEAMKADIDLAVEREAFPIWDMDNDNQSDFLLRIYNELPDEYQTKWNTTGRRNLGLLTIAPTGSISLLAEVSSGIEPVFSVVDYKKNRVTDNGKYDIIEPETGDKYKIFKRFHKPFVEWYQHWISGTMIEGITLSQAYEDLQQFDTIDNIIEASPYYKATAHDIDYVSKIQMQGAVQKWIDSAISNTVNIPNAATVEQVEEILLSAWESGCKGTTIYRSGTRMNIISKTLNTTTNTDWIRPELLDCDIHNVKVDGKEWTVIIGLFNGKPYEVFTFENKQIHIKQKCKGKLIKGERNKKGRSTYNLETDYIQINDIGSLYTIKDQALTARMISMYLQNGGKVSEVIKHADKVGTDITQFSQAIKRVLSFYTDEEKLGSCPECHKGDLIRQEGCIKCNNCNYSKC